MLRSRDKLPSSVRSFACYFKSGLLMDEVMDGSATLIYADTPFAINHKDGSQYNRTKDSLPYVEWRLEEYMRNIPVLLDSAWKKLKNNGSMVLWSAWNRLPEALAAVRRSNFAFINEIIWRYNFGVFAKRKLVTSHYDGLVLTKSPSHKFNFQLPMTLEQFVNGRKVNYNEDVWVIKRPYHFGTRTARNEQPLQLALKTINHYTDKGDLVVDCCVGSGTTMVASALLGRRWIGYELEPRLLERIRSKANLIRSH